MTTRQRDPEKLREYRSRYKKTPKGAAANARYAHRRRMNEQASLRTLTVQEWETILRNQGLRCYLCHVRFDECNPPTKDHRTPISRGGGLTFENVSAACRRCNSSKNNRTPEEFFASRSLLPCTRVSGIIGHETH